MGDVGPILKWAGGKRELAPMICELLGEPGRRYVEPFVGGGAVFFERNPKVAILADSNRRLINVYAQVRDDPDRVAAYLGLLPSKDWRDQYCVIRRLLNELPATGALAAAVMIWVNKACFNGLYRENKRGKFNVPAGSYSVPSLPSRDHLRAVSGRLAATQPPRGYVVSTSYEALTGLGAGDEVYCDPPYVPLKKDGFVDYTARGFTLADHERLEAGARVAVQRGATVVLSNHDVPWVRELYSSDVWELHEVQASRSVGASAATRKKIGELVIVGRP